MALTVAGALTLADITVVARGGGLKILSKASYDLYQLCRKGIRVVAILLTIGFFLILTGPGLESFLPPFWVKTVGYILAAIVPSLAGLAMHRRQRPRKVLSYSISSLTSMYTTDASYRSRVTVEYMGRLVKKLHSCQVMLQNTGNRTLENQGVLIKVAGAEILKTEAFPEPELEFGTITLDDNLGKDRVKYRFSRLEPRDKVTVDLTLEGDVDQPAVKVSARAPMLKVHPAWPGIKLDSVVTLATVPVALVFLLYVAGLGFHMDGPRQLGYLISDWLVDVSAQPGFLSGLLIGVAGFSLVVFLVFRVRVWWSDVTAPLRDEEVWRTTGKTAARDFSVSILLLGLEVLVSILVVEIIRPGALLKLLDFLGL